MALVLLVLLLPLFILVALLTAALARRSPFVTHSRIGRYGEPFEMLKFRTMWGARENEKPPEGTKSIDDPRVCSAFARFLRRYSIDEAPQLVHVVSGRMAFAGPRPLTRVELTRYYGASAGEMLTARPGLTGLWQVMGRSRLTYHQRRRLDLFLVRRPAMRLRALILLRTIPQVISGRNSW